MKPVISAQKQIGAWLLIVAVSIWLMVMIGGATRLTGSGLSITEWKPIMGTLPPTTIEEWQAAFKKYQDTPQFNISNPDMNLQGFKFIFFWEYIHRLWGRVLGIIFAVPFLYFLVMKKLNRSLGLKLFCALILGAAQGFLGWFMVQSGLIDKPWVSPYRLAAHLALALGLFSFILWLSYDLLLPKKSNPPSLTKWVHWAVPALLGLLSLQIIWGAFMAGGKLALTYPSFPDYNGQWLPAQLFEVRSLWHHVFENPAAVHLIHRSLGTFLLLAVIVFWWKTKPMQWSGILGLVRHGLLACILIQFLLGVTTLVLSKGHIPILWGVLHQSVAVLLLALILLLWNQTKRIPNLI